MFNFRSWLRSFSERVRQLQRFVPSGIRWKRVRTTHRPRSWYFPLSLTALESRIVPVTDTWTGGAGTTDWNTAGNWSNGVPTASSDVVIDNATVVHSSGNDTINSLTLISLAYPGSAALLQISSGSSITSLGAITDNGNIEIGDSSTAGTLNVAANTSTITAYPYVGGGAILFGANPANSLALTSTGTLTIAADVLINGQNGSITGIGSIVNDSQISCGSGASGDTIIVNPTSFTNNSSVIAGEGGTMDLSAGLTNYDRSTGTLSGTGTYEATGGGTLILPGDVINNEATLHGDGSTSSIVDPSFNDALSGHLTQNSGLLWISAYYPFTAPTDFTNTNEVTIDNDTFLSPAGSTYTQNTGTTSITSGTIRANETVVLAGGVLEGSGTIAGTLTVENSAQVESTVSGQTLDIETTTNYSTAGGGTLSGGQWDAFYSSTLELNGDPIATNDAYIYLEGAGSYLADNNSGDDALANTLKLNDTYGELKLTSDATLTLTTNALVNKGIVDIESATLRVTSYEQAAYQLTYSGDTYLVAGVLAANVTIAASGSFPQPSGMIEGNVYNNGNIELLEGDVLTITGNLTQGSSANVTDRISGPSTSNANFGELVVQGTASFALQASGTLSVDTISYLPTTSDTYPILTFASETGSFQYFYSPQLDGYNLLSESFSPSSNPTSLLLSGTSYFVTTTANSGPGSLSDAINTANTRFQTNILFNIPITDSGYDPNPTSFLIQPQIPLPTITSTVIIDGTTENDYLLANSPFIIGTPVVELDGTLAGTNNDGLVLTDSESVIKGLVIDNFNGAGISLDGSSTFGDSIVDNFLGADPTGNSAGGNGYGIVIQDGAHNNTIGSTQNGDQNVISGNSYDDVDIIGPGTMDNVVEGNLIGTNLPGSSAVGNTTDGVLITGDAADNTIGATVAGAGNVISGTDFGVAIGYGTLGNVVDGNLIGTNATGNSAIPNQYGIYLASGASHNIIGDSSFGTGNLISGNSVVGIFIVGIGTDKNLVEGNRIGTNALGNGALGNSNGLEVTSGAVSNTIGGTSGEGNLISGNLGTGLFVSGSGTMNTLVVGNDIGTDISGLLPLGNGGAGVTITNGATSNTIGGPTFGALNVIADNDDGIDIGGSGTSQNLVEGNDIGTDKTGNAALGNINNGVVIGSGASDNTIGGKAAVDLNVISGNSTNGILIIGSAAAHNLIAGNLIGTNSTGNTSVPNLNGIELEGANSNTVGGSNTTGSGPFHARNIISGNSGIGLVVSAGGLHNLVEGNFIGTNRQGTQAVANSMGLAISTAASNKIGGTTSGERNLISGNTGDGIYINQGSMNVVLGNYIGPNYAGTQGVQNSSGVAIVNGSTNNTIGGILPSDRNIISGTRAYNAGVSIGGTGTTGNVVEGNYIGPDYTGMNSITHNFSNYWGVLIFNGATGNIIGGLTTQVGAYAGNVLSNNFLSVGIQSSGTKNNVVEGNVIGLGSAGFRLENEEGVVIDDGAQDNTIGGTTSEARNVVSGNVYGFDIGDTGTDGNIVEGNYIGTNESGTSSIANEFGIDLSLQGDNNIIGGTAIGDSNIISGNYCGIEDTSDANNTKIEGNDIGTDYTGTRSIPNYIGIIINGASDITIGGILVDSGNLISGNSNFGLSIQDSHTINIWQNQIGTTANGLNPLGNGGGGIKILDSSNISLGGNVAGEQNVISGNESADGVLIDDSSHNIIEGDLIGLGRTGGALTSGTASIVHGNSKGIVLSNSAASNQIGGTTSAARNVISANSAGGIFLSTGAVGNIIEGNFIGTNVQGNGSAVQDVDYQGEGIVLSQGAHSNHIGGTRPGEGNTIGSNSGDGIFLSGSTTISNRIFGNFIGTDADGDSLLGNGNGIDLAAGASDNIIGSAAPGATNVIDANDNDGILIDATTGVPTLGNAIDNNLIGVDQLGTNLNPLAIALGNLKAGVLIDGASANTLANNVISSNQLYGVEITASYNPALSSNLIVPNGNILQGNRIGTDPTGELIYDDNGQSFGNVGDGILLQGAIDNTIGGTTLGEGNLISGNMPDSYSSLPGSGIQISGYSNLGKAALATGNLVEGNLIGTDMTGETSLRNAGDGITLSPGATSNNIGGADSSATFVISPGVGAVEGLTTAFIGNLISGNRGNGVYIDPNPAALGPPTYNMVSGNFIGVDITGTAALGNQLNGVLIDGDSNANTIGGTLNGVGNVISGNGAAGVELIGTPPTVPTPPTNTSNNFVEGNYIGTNAAGESAVGNSTGVEISSGATNNTIGGETSPDRNLISGNTNSGVLITDTFTSGNVVAGNDIGTDILGSSALPNGQGVTIQSGATSNIIGSQQRIGGNLISGNAGNNTGFGIEILGIGTSENVVEGNLIGTDLTGKVPLPDYTGVSITDGASNNTIGGTTAGTGNIISGNTHDGIAITTDLGPNEDSFGNTIEGNFIGTDITGQKALGNLVDGILLDLYSATNVIGGILPAATNIISGNGNDGIQIEGAATANVIEGDDIGTNLGGTKAIPNNDGIEVSENAFDNTIGGNTTKARNIISGNVNDGVALDATGGGSNGNTVASNFIGVDVSGLGLLPNAIGIVISGAYGNTIGGTTLSAANIISGNLNLGVLVDGNDNDVEGNFIGTGYTNNPLLGNPIGLLVEGINNTIGGDATDAGNTIANNTEYGVEIEFGSSTGNAVLGNTTYNNGDGTAAAGITLTNGATSGTSEIPVILAFYTSSSSTSVVGSLTGTPDTTFDLNFFANDSGSQGQHYLGAATIETDPSGVAYFNPSWPSASSPNQLFTVTVTSYGTTGTDQTNTLPFTVLSGFTATPHTPPAVTISGPSAAIIGLPVVYTSTVTDSNSSQPSLTYSWTVTGPGSSSLSGTGFALPETIVTDEPTLNFTPTLSGTYDIQLTVNDGASIVASNTIPLLAGPVGPGVVISGLSQDLIEAGTIIPLSGTLLSGTGATAVSYDWTITANGNTTPVSSGPTFNFVEQTSGLYKVSLTIVGSDQTVSVSSIYIEVTGGSPQADILGALSNTLVGVPISVAAGGNDSGLSGTLAYSWTVIGYESNQEVYLDYNSSNTFTFTPPTPGYYGIYLSVNETSFPYLGAEAETSFTVRALPAPPTATLTLTAPVSSVAGTPVTAGTAASLTANVITQPPGITYSYTLTLLGQNGSFVQSADPTLIFTPNRPGAYIASVTAVGSDGRVLTAEEAFTVDPILPTVAISDPLTIPSPSIQATQPGQVAVGTPVTYRAQVGGIGNGTGPLQFQWIISGPNHDTLIGTGPTITFTPTEASLYTISLLMIDAYGISTAPVVTTLTPAPAPLPSVAILNAAGSSYDPNDSTFTQNLIATISNAPTNAQDTYQWSLYLNQVLVQSQTDTNPNFSFSGDLSLLENYTAIVTVTNFNNTPTATTTFQITTSGSLVLAPAATGTQILALAAGDDVTIDASELPASVSVVEVALGGHDTLIGGAGPTILQGDSGNNLLEGGSGADTLIATSGDTLLGGTGASNLFQINPGPNEVATAGTENNTLSFASSTTNLNINLDQTGNQAIDPEGDSISLNGAFQTLIGGSGNDNLMAGAASKVLLFGGTGNDNLSASGGSSITLVAGSGSDTLSFTGETQGLLVGGVGNALLTQTSGSSITMFGGSGNDTLASSGGSSITLMGGTGNDTLSASYGTGLLLQGGANTQLLTVTGGTSITMFGGTGNDSLSSSGGPSITLVSVGGDDTLASLNGTDVVLQAGSANSVVSQTGGSSITMFGGTGSDTLASSGGSSITLVGGSGNDTLSSNGSATNILLLAGTGSSQLLTQTGGSSITMFGGSGNDSLSPSGGSSITLTGSGGNDTLSSTGGSSNLLVGGSGTETLTQSGGSSITMFGGTGNDSLSSSGGSSITLVAGTGSDTLSSSGGSSLLQEGGSGTDTLSSSGGTSITMFGGTGNDTLASSGGSSITLVAGSGNDSLAANNGTDVLLVGNTVPGSTGNDSLTSSGGSSITMFGGTGNDSLSSSGGSSVTIVGGSGNDTLSSSSASNILLQGGTGDDSLSVSGGSSITMFGGSGNDSLSSSGGSSITLVGGSGSDSLDSSGGSNILIEGGLGSDSLSASGGTSITMFGGTGNDSLSSSGGSSITLSGGSGSDTLSSTGGTVILQIGGNGSDLLSSSGGSSITMFGGTGNDSLSSSGGSSITMVGGSGNDSLSTSGGATVLQVGGDGTDQLSSSGGSSITMFGGTGNDSLSSSGGSSITLAGGSGSDSLSGTNDTVILLQGGTGNDTLTSSGGSSITLFGGTGNDSLSSSGGSSITLIGGSGNDTLNSSNGTLILQIGGDGNDTLIASGGTSITMFGGTGNDSLSASGGSSISLVGGSGSDTLNASQVDTGLLLNGGDSGDLLNSSGGSSITMFGGAGNDTLAATGGGVAMYGEDGDNTYEVSGDAADPIVVSINTLATFGQNLAQDDSQTQPTNTLLFPGVTSGIDLNLSDASTGTALTGSQFQNVATGITLGLTGTIESVVGTTGPDWIEGGAGSTQIDGAGGNDTLIAGSGATTILAGSGDDSLVAGTGGTTFLFTNQTSGNDIIAASTARVANTLDFSAFDRGVTLDLGSTATQSVGKGLELTLQEPDALNRLIDSDDNDTITGNASGDSFILGSGNDNITGGGGSDAFYFRGSQLGADTITETSSGNSLNFYNFDQGIALNLRQAEQGQTQQLEPGSASSPTLTLSDPAALSTIVGTPYNDTIVGNETANQTIIGGGGEDSLQAGNGNDEVQGYVSQVVYLAFPSPQATLPSDHIYTPLEEAAILQGLETDYSDFNYVFTLDPSTAEQLAAMTGGLYATLSFDAPVVGGAADELDTGNLDLGGTALINVTPFLGSANAGLVPPTSANIIGLSTTIAAHELGHLSGLQHQDALGPIGTGISAGVNPDSFLPPYEAYATTTTLTSSLSPHGDRVFTATVASTNPQNGQPSGVVDFFDETTQTDLTPEGVIPTNGTASLNIATLSSVVSPGDVIVATFTSTVGFGESTASETLVPILTTTTLTYTGQNFFVTVSAGAAIPSGSVELTDTSTGTTYILNLYGGGADLPPYDLEQQPSRGDVFTATYIPSDDFASSSASVQISQGSTTITSFSYTNYGYYSYFSVQIQSTTTESINSGTLDYYDVTAKHDIGQLNLLYDSPDLYSFNFAYQPAIGDVICVTYRDASGNLSGSSASLTIAAVPTNLTVITFGPQSSLEAIVAGGNSTPTGTVDFYDATTQEDLGSATLFYGFGFLNAPFSTPAAIGDEIVATYSGDGTHPETTATLTMTYEYSQQSGTASETLFGTTLIPGSLPDAENDDLTLTATISTSGEYGVAAPTGTVDFFDITTNTDLGQADLNSIVSLAVPASVAGDRILLSYSGDSNYFPSQASFDVPLITTTISLSSAANAAGYQLVATLASESGSTPSGDSVVLSDSMGLLKDVAEPLLDGTASLTVMLPSDDIVTATFAGDDNYLGSSTSAEVFPSATTTNLQTNVSSNDSTITWSATVTTASGVVPAGNVAFIDESTGANLTTLGGVLSSENNGVWTLTLQNPGAFGLASGDLVSAIFTSSTAFSGSEASQIVASNAFETDFDVMASPDSVGSTLLDAAGTTYLGERDDVILAFNDTGTVYQQANLQPAPPPPKSIIQIPSPLEIGTGVLPTLAVPNTLPEGVAGSGETFDVTAAAVDGTLTSANANLGDFYAFLGQTGQLMTFQVISNTDTQNANPILIPELVVVGPQGQIVAFNVHEFESADSTILDVTLPATGWYYVGVSSGIANTGGNYQLFMYSFATSSTASDPDQGDTLSGGTGNDTLVGSSGNDLFYVNSVGSNQTTIISGSGNDTIMNQSSGNLVEPVTVPAPTTLLLSADQPTAALNQPVTFIATIAGLWTINSVSLTSDLATLTTTSAVPFSVGETITVTGLTNSFFDGTFEVVAVTPYSVSYQLNHADLRTTADAGTIAGGEPTGTIEFLDSTTEAVLGMVSLIDQDGVDEAQLTVSALPLGNNTITAIYATTSNFEYSYGKLTEDVVNKILPHLSVSDPSGTYNATPFEATATVNGESSLEGFAPTLSYYAGNTASGTPLAAAPTDVGTYTVVASFPGSPDYASASEQVTFVISPASLTVTGITAADKVYDGTTAATPLLDNATLTGVFNGDQVTLNRSGVTGTFGTKNVGDAIAVTFAGFTLSGAQSNDYSLSQPATEASITPATLTVTANNASKLYGQSDPTLTDTITGFVNGDSSGNITGSAELTTSATSSSPVGNYTIAVSAGSLSATNYTFDFVSGILSITPATPTLTLNSSSPHNTSTYGSLVTFTATLVGNDVCEAAGESVSFWDGTNSLGTGTLSSNGIAMFTTTATQFLVGSQTITAVYTGDSDFNNVFANLSNGQTVLPAPLVISPNSENPVYGFGSLGSSASLVTITGALYGTDEISMVVLATNASVSTSGNYNAGSWNLSVMGVTGAGLSNYNITLATLSNGLSIQQKSLTLSGLAATNKTYDGTPTDPLAGTAFLSGLVGNDAVTALNTTTGTFASVNAATGLAVSTTATLSGADASNYTLVQQSGLTANITPATSAIAINSSTPNNTSTLGQSVTFTAVVTSSVGTPTGTVDFYVGNTVVSVALVNGVALFTTTTLAQGADTIEAVYNDPNEPTTVNNNYSTCNQSLIQTVNASGPVDITSDTSYTHTAGSADRVSGVLYIVQSCTLTNKTSISYPGPIVIVFNNMTAGTIVDYAIINGTIVNAQKNSSGQYTITLLSGTFLGGQELSFSVFYNQSPGPNYSVQVLAQ